MNVVRGWARTSGRRAALTAIVAAAFVVAVPSAFGAPPSNDNLAGATVLTTLPFTETVAGIAEATTESGEPLPWAMGQNTVWYRLTPSSRTVVRAQVQGMGYYVLNAYRADGPGMTGLTYLTGFISAPIVFDVQAGSTYYIQAGNFSPVPVQWWETFTFGLTIVPPPPNDNFANAKVISSLPFDDSVDVTGATTEPGEPNPSPLCGGDISKSVWYSFTATTSGMYNAGTSGGSQGGVNVYTGSSLDNLTRVACGSSATGVGAFHADAGTTYYLQSGTWMGGSGALLGARLELTPPPAVGFIWGPSFPTRFDNITFQGRYLDPIGIDSWAWDFGDGGTATGNFPQHQYAQDGDYSVTVTGTTPDGRTNSATEVVRVRTPDTPPQLTVPAGVTANATSPTGATVTYAVTATDDNPAPPTVNCTPPSGATFAIGDTTVACVATDATGNTTTAGFTVHVSGAAQQLGDLYEKVIGVGSGTSLADKVVEARTALARGDITATHNSLRAFVNQVKAPSQKIDAATAASLVADATRITKVLGY